MFIKEAVLNAGRKIFNEKNVATVQNNILVQFLFFTTLKNYIYRWITEQKLFIIPQNIKSKANKKKHILVLDMDETLVYTRRQQKPNHYNFVRSHSEKDTMYIQTRPFVQQFLKAVSEIFIVYVYTAGAKSYADSVLDIIDVQKVIQKRFYRESCKKMNGNVIKDLKYIKKTFKIKEQMILLDDNVDSINNNYPFAVRIEAFQGDQKDIQLIKIFQKLIKFYV